MSQGTVTNPGHACLGADAEIVLREENFLLAARVLKAETPAEIGELFGVHERTIKRAKATGIAGPVLIANSLRKFGERRRKLASVGLKPTFETFFEVR